MTVLVIALVILGLCSAQMSWDAGRDLWEDMPGQVAAENPGEYTEHDLHVIRLASRTVLVGTAAVAVLLWSLAVLASKA